MSETSIEQDGFIVGNSKKIKFQDVKSIWYVLLHWQDEDDFNRGVQVLTKNGGVQTFTGDYSELIPVFDQNLERWSGVDDADSPYGIYRWKQPGKEYHFVSEMDERAYKNEKFAYKRVSKKWIWYGLAVIVIILLIATFYFELS